MAGRHFHFLLGDISRKNSRPWSAPTNRNHSAGSEARLGSYNLKVETLAELEKALRERSVYEPKWK